MKKEKIPNEIGVFKPNVMFLSDVYWQKGIYFLYMNMDLRYIGMSNGTISRVNGHTDKKYNKIWFLPVYKGDREDLHRLEEYLISYFKPVLNVSSINSYPDVKFQEIIELSNKLCEKPLLVEKGFGYKDMAEYLNVRECERKRLKKAILKELKAKYYEKLQQEIDYFNKYTTRRLWVRFSSKKALRDYVDLPDEDFDRAWSFRKYNKYMYTDAAAVFIEYKYLLENKALEILELEAP